MTQHCMQFLVGIASIKAVLIHLIWFVFGTCYRPGHGGLVSSIHLLAYLPWAEKPDQVDEQ